VGTFRTYVRASNGLKYIINPEDMQNVILSLNYTSRTGRTETITFTCALAIPVSNATGRETIGDIKNRAPARFYTQNRMVNGEDYNNFPYTQYSTIIKSKAINRSSIGISRYADLTDVTSKYSSTNVFGSDGCLYENNLLPSFNFTFTDINDINNVIANQVEPALRTRGMLEFYYDNFVRPNLVPLALDWVQSTVLANQTTGYFAYQSTGNPAPIGGTVTDDKKYITQYALVKFEPPTGYYFDKFNKLQLGSPSLPDDKLVIWTTISNVVGDGTNFNTGNLTDGSGPVTITDFVPTEAIPTQVIPKFVTDLPSTFEQSMTDQIEL
jgi:hypothetical protein